MQNRSCMPEKTTGTKQQSVTEWFNMHFSVCWGSESAAWLTSVWRRMCCNSPGGPIPPRGYAEQDAEKFSPSGPTAQNGSSFSEKWETENRDSLFFSERPALQVWTGTISRRDSILKTCFSQPCLNPSWKDMGYCRYHSVDKDRLWVGKTHANT